MKVEPRLAERLEVNALLMRNNAGEADEITPRVGWPLQDRRSRGVNLVAQFAVSDPFRMIVGCSIG
jgi:hypothetical protein